MKRVKQFGETVEGYNIPVLTEKLHLTIPASHTRIKSGFKFPSVH
jgi:hypothetical protein